MHNYQDEKENLKNGLRASMSFIAHTKTNWCNISSAILED